MDKRYIQLYSLNKEAEADFEGTLKKIAAMGYTGIEFAGFFGNKSASELKKFMAELGLEALSTHTVSENVPEILDYAAELGVKYIIDPWASIYTYDETMAFCEVLNKTGKLCKDRGIIFGYHNHAHEFIEGKDGYLLETMILNTDPAMVGIQLDVGWTVYAGADAVGFLKKYPGRFKLIHVKECSKARGPQGPDEGNGWNVKAGTGIIDWVSVRDAAIASGAEAFIVEREFDYLGDIFKCVEEDCDFLREL